MDWLLCSCHTDFHCITVMQLLCLWGLYSWTIFVLWWRNKALFSLYFFADRGRLYSVPKCPWGRMIICCYSNPPPSLCNEFSYILVLTLPSCSCLSVSPTLCIVWQVLGRKSPFPLILLPQFGGYWIEGTNHELSDTVDSGQLQPLSPNTRTKLECNTTASLYRKHFLGKVSYCLQHTHGLLCNNYVSIIPLFTFSTVSIQ